MLPVVDNSRLVIVTKIQDLQIRSALDTGFLGEYGMASAMHSHPYCELLISIDDEFSVEFSKDKSILVKPNCICLVPSGVYHCTRDVSPTSKKLAIRFNYTHIFQRHQHDSVYDVCNKAVSSCKETILFENCQQLCQIIKQIRDEITSSQLASSVIVQTLLTQFYVHFFRIFCENGCQKTYTQPSDVSEQDLRWLKIENFLDRNYINNIVESDLAAELNISKRQLSRILQTIYGVSFRQLLIEIRLRRAAQLLTETNWPIEDIVRFVGYTSLTGFYTAFNNKFGVSAGKYRKDFTK